MPRKLNLYKAQKSMKSGWNWCSYQIHDFTSNYLLTKIVLKNLPKTIIFDLKIIKLPTRYLKTLITCVPKKRPNLATIMKIFHLLISAVILHFYIFADLVSVFIGN